MDDTLSAQSLQWREPWPSYYYTLITAHLIFDTYPGKCVAFQLNQNLLECFQFVPESRGRVEVQAKQLKMQFCGFLQHHLALKSILAFDSIYSHCGLLNESLDERVMICDLWNAYSQNQTQ